MNSGHKKIVFITVLVVVVFINIDLKYIKHFSIYSKNISIPIWQPKTNKTILFWDTFWGTADFGFGTGTVIFKNCEVQACIATYNKSYIPVQDFDAILFHGATYSMRKDSVPKTRNLNQKYVFYNRESYHYSDIDVNTYENFYNWSMTFKRDSDIFAPYGKLIPKRTNYKLPTEENLQKRTKKIAWFVSNCNHAGTLRRTRYVKELSKYIPVDIYGACGSLKCPRTKSGGDDCYKMLERNYKFYLSFENSLCEDYITEKVYNILKLDVVPIVLSFVDYDALFPKQSLINANHFINPKHLANYLWQLDKNRTEYLKYFEWKKYYVVHTKKDLCDLCKKLHEPLVYSSYKNIMEWYFGYNCVI